jgi:hypothetical protein
VASQCERRSWKVSFLPKYILLGEHFERPDDIIFETIYVTYRGNEVNKWIKRVSFQARLNSHDSAKVKVRGNYNISVLGRPKLLSWSDAGVPRQSRREIPCIEIESIKEQKKSLEDYLKVSLIVFDFLNFVITEEVHIEFIYEIMESVKDANEKNDNSSANSQENKPEVRIFYDYAISNMFKPNRRMGAPLFPFESERYETEALLEKYLKKWFTLSYKARPFVALYFGVMYNT